jgi:hypothetical protein
VKKTFFIWAAICSFLLTCRIAQAQDGDFFVVISGRRISNVVVVAKSGGQYQRIQDAIDSITNASLYNPYLVVVGPGVYNERVTLKASVHLQGAGKGVTIISSDVSYDRFFSLATVALRDSTSVRDLTIWNFGTGEYNVALSASSADSVEVSDVEVYASPVPVFNGSGQSNAGIAINESNVTLNRVTAIAQFGHEYNYGLYSLNSTVKINGGSFTGRGGNWAMGIVQGGGSLSPHVLTAIGISATGEGGIFHSYGLHAVFQPSVCNITQSVLRGDSFSVHRDNASVTVTHSALVGTVSGTCTCVGVSEGTTFYTNTCP